jgi:ribosomal protein S18 acetylase RimI-like enzyme
VSVRRATAADAAAIAGVALRAALHADELLDPDELEADPEGWASVLDRATVVVHEVHDRVAGVVATGGGQVVVLAVDPSAQGAGVGTLLLDVAEAALRMDGRDEGVCWVPERDEGAARLGARRRASRRPVGPAPAPPQAPHLKAGAAEAQPDGAVRARS